MIDLADAETPLRELIGTSLETFASEKPDESWFTFALYACPWAGWITTCFDTEANSAKSVADFESEGPDWYGEDEWGRYNNNCPDFLYFEWRLLEFPRWQSEYEETEPIHVRDLKARDHFIGSENEAINGLVFDFLQPIFREELTSIRESPFLPRDRHRFGVQMRDSEFLTFWRGQTADG